MNYTIIVLVFIILMMLYMGYLYMTNTNLINGVNKLNVTNTPITWTKLQNPSSTTYHYEGWLYIKSKPTIETTVFSRSQFSLVLVGTQLAIVDTTEPVKTIIITDDFPLQKWVYFVINVVNNSIVEAYLNGKLVTTKQISLSTPNTKSDVVYGMANGIDGYITKFKRDPVALTPDEARNKYLEGNGLATFSNFIAGYNASFSLFNTEGTIKQYTLL